DGVRPLAFPCRFCLPGEAGTSTSPALIRSRAESAMSVKPTATPAESATASAVAAATRAVVQEFLAARLAGDTVRLAAIFADEVDWQLADNPGVPWIRPRSTAAECAAQFTELMQYTV